MTRIGWIALIMIAFVAMVGITKKATAGTIGTSSDVARMSVPVSLSLPVVEELGTPYFEILGGSANPMDAAPTATENIPQASKSQPVGVQRDLIDIPSEYTVTASA